MMKHLLNLEYIVLEQEMPVIIFGFSGMILAKIEKFLMRFGFDSCVKNKILKKGNCMHIFIAR